MHQARPSLHRRAAFLAMVAVLAAGAGPTVVATMAA